MLTLLFTHQIREQTRMRGAVSETNNSPRICRGRLRVQGFDYSEQPQRRGAPNTGILLAG